MGENKKTLCHWELRSIRFIIEFILKLSSLVALMSFIIFRHSLWLENPFNGLVNELWENGRVLTKKS